MAQRLRLALPVIAVLLLGVLIYRLQNFSAGSSSHAAAASSTPTTASTSAPANPATTAPAGAPPVSNAPAGAFTGPAMHQLPEQEMERLNNLEPQEQAEQMMQDAVKHFEGVPEMIVSRTGSWQGKIANTHNWQVVELEARYSSDLRVRDAAIEVDLVISGLDRNADSVRRLIEDAAANPANHPADSVILGMLANRGIETDRVHSTLRTWAHDPSEETRYWAIEGLAFLGTDDTIDDFIEVLRSDPALNVRQRCGASLAKSGMLTREQRMKAVPGLIDIAADPNQDSTTRGWAFQALHEITAETISAEAGAWRSWYDAHGSERIEQFHNMNRNWILGNS